jgi:hypothetical protein
MANSNLRVDDLALGLPVAYARKPGRQEFAELRSRERVFADRDEERPEHRRVGSTQRWRFIPGR